MRVECYPDIAAFWRDAKGFLERDETGNTQLLAIAGRHAADPGESPPAGYLVFSEGEPIAAALLTKKGTLFLSAATEYVLHALHETLAGQACQPVDVVAVRDTALAFADLTGASHRTHVRLQLYRLDAVSPIAPVAGAMRLATQADFDLLCAWQQAFVREANIREGADEIPEQVARRLKSAGAWLWEVGGMPVSHAAARPTPIRSARIAPVYTPDAHRGRGYAAALVAQMCRYLLREGRHPLYLYADMTNATANGIYRRVGFHPAGEHLHLTRDDA